MPGERPLVGTLLSLQPLGTFFLVPLILKLVDGCPTPNLELMFGGSVKPYTEREGWNTRCYTTVSFLSEGKLGLNILNKMQSSPSCKTISPFATLIMTFTVARKSLPRMILILSYV